MKMSKKLVAIILTIVLMLSTVTPGLAAYDGDVDSLDSGDISVEYEQAENDESLYLDDNASYESDEDAQSEEAIEEDEGADPPVIAVPVELIGIMPLSIFPVTNSTQLTNALAAIGTGTGTILLEASFSHATPIHITNGAVITLETGPHTLDVNVATNHALQVTNSSQFLLDETGGGAVNVTSVIPNANAVRVTAGSKAQVSNATSTGGHGAYANGANAVIHVSGNASGGAHGVVAIGGGQITVGGNVTTISAGAQAAAGASGANSRVYVIGDALAPNGLSRGIIAEQNSVITVINGDVISSNIGADARTGGSIYINNGDVSGNDHGVVASSGGQITVVGNVTTSSTVANRAAIGADGLGSSVTITGNASAPNGPSRGVIAVYNSVVTVLNGDVISGGANSIGADARSGASININNGDVSGELRGALAQGAGSQINITGNATATGGTGTGADAQSGGQITVDGTITATVYVVVDGSIFAQGEHTGQDATHYEFEFGTSMVRVAHGISASISNVTIGNAGGNVVITLANDTFATTLTAPTTWITNLPAGMTQTATRISATEVTIAISGTPTAASTAQIAVTIPAASLVTSTINLTTTANPNAVFATTVTPTTTPTSSPTIVPTSSPTITPTSSPAIVPTSSPTITPTSSPAIVPTSSPAIRPTSPPGSVSSGSTSSDQDARIHAQRPRIIRHPQSITAYVNDSVSLSVTASVTDGGTLTYQWYRAEGESGGRFTAIPNATDRTFNPNTDTVGVNRYRVVVTNTNNASKITGNRVVRITSNIATVTVIYPEAVTPEPAQILAPLPLLRFELGSYTYTHNGTTLQSDAAPFIDPTYDRVMVPLRLIAEAIGADVEWVEATRSVNISLAAASLSLTIGESLPDGMGVPVIVNDRTLVPLRYVIEVLGADVVWDALNRAVYVFEVS